MVKTVIFDVDNTLYSFDDANVAASHKLMEYVEEKLGLTREKFQISIQKAELELREYMGDVAAIHNRVIRYQRALEELDMPLQPYVLEMNDLYWNTLIQEMIPSPGARVCMETLKKQGIRIGIGTDMTARVQLQKLEALGMLEYIDFVVSSEEAGAEKPSKKFFDRCMAKAKCAPKECLFVGDNYEKDIVGARRAGMKPIWYCPEGCGRGEGVAQIDHLDQLIQIAAL